MKHFIHARASIAGPAVAVAFACAALMPSWPAATAEGAESTAAVPIEIELEGDRALGLFDRMWNAMITFQREANEQIATHMNAIESGQSITAFLVGLGIAFVYGTIHALGPGHGKFVIMSYFMGRDVRVKRGLVMALQMAVVHVIAAVVIVWFADAVLKASFGVGLAEVPGVRASSFLIITAIGLYMLYQAVRTSLGYIDATEHGHSHGDAHRHTAGHSHSHSHSKEGGLLALAAGMVPCPGAVLIMLYAVANDMIYPGFLLVVAMSVGIGLTISVLGVGAIVARQIMTRVMESSGGGAVARFRSVSSYAGAIAVTTIGTVSFFAFLSAS